MHPNVEAIDEAWLAARSESVRSLLGYMRKIHPNDMLPSRAMFDPAELRNYLQDIVLVEVHRGHEAIEPRFFVRLAGERILHASPVPLMNMYLDEVVAGGVDRVIVDVRQDVVLTGRTYFRRGQPRVKFKFDFIEVIEYAHCPFADDGVNVDRIVSAFSYGSTR